MADSDIQETELESVAVETTTYNRKDGSGVGTIYKIGGADHRVYTSFSDSVGKIFETAGTKRKIKYQTKIQGNYTNYIIQDVANEKGEFEAKGKSYKGGMKADPAKTESIERQVAAKEAVNLIIHDKVKLEQLEETADRIFDWLKGGKNNG